MSCPGPEEGEPRGVPDGNPHSEKTILEGSGLSSPMVKGENSQTFLRTSSCRLHTRWNKIMPEDNGLQAGIVH